MSSVRQSLAERAIAAAGRVAPVRPMMGSMSARAFSSQIQTSDSEAEDDTQEKGGRFFKFLEKAEQLDETIKQRPAEAKKVSKEGEEEEVVMFDADEIEISFADQASEKAISDDLIDSDQPSVVEEKELKPRSREE